MQCNFFGKIPLLWVPTAASLQRIVAYMAYMSGAPLAFHSDREVFAYFTGSGVSF